MRRTGFISETFPLLAFTGARLDAGGFRRGL
jgi:hypothetical protein